MRKSPGRYGPEFKLAVVERLLAGERPRTVAGELELPQRLLYEWRAAYRKEGAGGLRMLGRPKRSPAGQPRTAVNFRDEQMAKLERKIGRQQLVIDFLQAALRRVEGESGPTSSVGVSECIPWCGSGPQCKAE